MLTIPVKCDLCTNSAKYVHKDRFLCYPHYLPVKSSQFLTRMDIETKAAIETV